MVDFSDFNFGGVRCPEDLWEREEDSGGMLLLRCRVCNYVTNRRQRILRHVEALHFSLGYACEECGETLKTKLQRYRHKIKVHGGAGAGPSSSVGDAEEEVILPDAF